MFIERTPGAPGRRVSRIAGVDGVRGEEYVLSEDQGSISDPEADNMIRRPVRADASDDGGR